MTTTTLDNDKKTNRNLTKELIDNDKKTNRKLTKELIAFAFDPKLGSGYNIQVNDNDCLILKVIAHYFLV